MAYVESTMGKRRRKLNTTQNCGQSQEEGHSIDGYNELNQNNHSMSEEGSHVEAEGKLFLVK